MNLGQAVAICLYELIRERRLGKSAAKYEPAPAGSLERTTTTLMDALEESGYVKPGSKDQAVEKIRRLIRRLNPQAEDAEILLGMMRQIVWKLRNKRSE